MKTILTFSLLICALTTMAQSLSISAATGLVNCSGPLSKEFRKISGRSNISGDFSVIMNLNRWQGGIGAGLYNLKSKTHFVFERDVIPNTPTHSYKVSIGSPTVNPYLFANYMVPIMKESRIYGGVRLGLLLPGKEVDMMEPYYSGRNSSGDIIMQSKPAMSYGLQAGFITQANTVLSTGVNLFWQYAHTSGTFNYDAPYSIELSPGVYRNSVYRVNETIKYNVHLFGLQIFLRYTLFNNTKGIESDEKVENQ